MDLTLVLLMLCLELLYNECQCMKGGFIYKKKKKKGTATPTRHIILVKMKTVMQCTDFIIRASTKCHF